MTFRISKIAVPAVLACAVATACSSKSATPDAYVLATVNGGNSCNFSNNPQFIHIGSDVAEGGVLSQNPTREPNGAVQGGTIGVSCSVKGSNGSFQVLLSASLSTNVLGEGGSFTISGTVDQTGGMNIGATFVAGGNTYQESDCTISYPTSPPGGPVDPGRIWGSIECPNAVESGKTTSNGGMVSCDISAIFVFENCSS